MKDLLAKAKVKQLLNVGIKTAQVSVISSFGVCNDTKLLVSAVFQRVDWLRFTSFLDRLTEHFPPSSHDLRCDINATNSLLNLASNPHFNNRFSERLLRSDISSSVGEKKTAFASQDGVVSHLQLACDKSQPAKHLTSLISTSAANYSSHLTGSRSDHLAE